MNKLGHFIPSPTIEVCALADQNQEAPIEVFAMISVLDCYRMKATFLPPELQSYFLYVRPGELSMHADPDHWDFAGRTMHPNHLQAAAVELRGYCERKLPIGIDVPKVAALLYDHPSSIAARG